MVLTIRPAWAGSEDGSGPSRTAERLAVRRAALPLFLTRGYATTTVEEIVATAGVSRRTFFRLFTGKHEVISCDHEVFHQELHTHLLQHQAERTIGRASRGVALVVDALTTVRDDAITRAELLASHPALPAEEARWFERHCMTVAHFLTGNDSPHTTIESEMTAAAIIAAARTAIRDSLDDQHTSANEAFAHAVDTFARRTDGAVRSIALVETDLDLDELLRRITRTDRT